MIRRSTNQGDVGFPVLHCHGRGYHRLRWLGRSHRIGAGGERYGADDGRRAQWCCSTSIRLPEVLIRDPTRGMWRPGSSMFQ